MGKSYLLSVCSTMSLSSPSGGYGIPPWNPDRSVTHAYKDTEDTLNLVPRSVDHNTEIGVVFTSPEIAGEMEDWFDLNIEELAFRLELHRQENGSAHIRWHGLENGRNRVFDMEPHAGFWRRFGVSFMSLLPIESQL